MSKKMSSSPFQSKQSNEVITYIRQTYGDELEFLWRKFPKNAIWRHQDNRKWYAALLVVKEDRILPGGDPEKEIEIIDLRFDKGAALDFAAENPHIYPGYHMNKNNWITVILDGSLPMKDLAALIDHSYQLTAK